MNIIAFNGSPRKNKNTATLLTHALEGAASLGAKTKLIHLYDLNFKGCVSCFACKRKDSKTYGSCSYQDDLTLILEEIKKADALIFGSPIFLGSISGEMKSFLERLVYPYLTYTKDYKTIFPRRIPTALFYTMNVTSKQMAELNYIESLKRNEVFLERTFGSVETFYVNDTSQFEDYSKYESSAFDLEKKAIVKKEQFPIDCQKAFDLGKSFVKVALS
ncbi:flavodoxin family protein [Candidatus Galacturonibacter soehngenii]|uniref:Flavodoxin family protein n=1 Tax=Candidatus Galacturonatibacter soehngenii TaxID=2307010 RepID=A0A7V7UBS9_9FIRM|nr:flavodoxin family protein [Candidatus Galacturonibacter soehngenii]KAB1438090.1 flavodoxin family protein [Candidatus Galacturonibacter soehngenii]